jgi:hypothetical protein
MDETVFERIRELPRADLESFALRAALHIRQGREDADPAYVFSATLFGFLLGAIVASSGFLLGVGLG